jgi:hypothetical protein
MLARNLLDMMVTSYAMAFDVIVDESVVVGTRKVLAKRYIEAHLKDPDLTPAGVAGACMFAALFA